MMQIAVFVGSLRKDSLNKKLARNLEELTPEGVEFKYVDMNLPLLNSDIESVPQEVETMLDITERANAVLVVTPEYNRGVPGVLKNAIDWGSHPKNVFKGKPVGIVGATTGPFGTAVAQSNLRQTVGYLGVHLMGQPELYFNLASGKFNQDGTVNDEYKDKLRHYMEKFTEHITLFV